MNYKVGIDIGGTFTDGVVSNEAGIKMFKVPSTPEDNTIAVMNLIKIASKYYDMSIKEFIGKIEVIVHSSTIAINTMLTKSGVTVGLISTRGFRDLLEFRRGTRTPDIPAFTDKVQFPSPLVPRNLRREVEERVLYNGKVLTPLNENDVRTAVRELKDQKVEAIAVALLFSFLYPDHEKRIEEIVREEYPEVYTSVSFEILPKIGEFERISSTVINAYLGPIISRHLYQLDKLLKDLGFRGELVIMQSNGGAYSVKAATRQPINTMFSGPASGIVSSILFGDLKETGNIISIDMGGTSFDACLIRERRIPITTERWICEQRVAIPMVDINSIGAGGGSVAWIDPSGILRVGPQSAGAVPGPACYGRGGKKPTVTDANLILGYLNPNYFLGGEIKLDLKAAKSVVKEEIAERLDLDTVEAAHAIYTMGNTAMAGGISLISTQRGYDPREFTLIVAGGAGPTHALRMAEELKISRVVIPKISPVYSAFGVLLSDFRHHYVRSYFCRSIDLNLSRINNLYSEMETEALKTLKSEVISGEEVSLIKSVDMRYVGQFHEIEVEIPQGLITPETIERIKNRFHKDHKELFTFSLPKRDCEFLNWKLLAIGRTKKPMLEEKAHVGKDSSKALKGRRDVFFKEFSEYRSTCLYDGDRLLTGNIIEGPAIVEEKAMTLVIPPGYVFEVDTYGNYVKL